LKVPTEIQKAIYQRRTDNAMTIRTIVLNK
jgi:hypothetical protein